METNSETVLLLVTHGLQLMRHGFPSMSHAGAHGSWGPQQSDRGLHAAWGCLSWWGFPPVE